MLMGGKFTSALVALGLLIGTRFAPYGNLPLRAELGVFDLVGVRDTGHAIEVTKRMVVASSASGLAPGGAGMVTFTDPATRHEAVDVEGSPIYSVSPSAGMRVGGPVNLSDGSATAPTGRPEFANLLNRYSARPSWNVAGVDYAVGVSAGTVLKDPATISIAGVSVDPTAHTATISGSNVVLSGYDFSLNGGWLVNVVGGSNVTISNNNFVIGSNNFAHAIVVTNAATNVAIINNNIDGAGHGGQGLFASNGAGTTTIKYNEIVNAYSELIVLGANSNTNTEDWVIEYNVVGNAGMGFGQGAHGDWIQTYNGVGTNTKSVAIDFNTFLQTIAVTEGRTQGLSLFSANSGSNSGGVQTESVNNNTFIVTPGGLTGAYVNYAIIIDTSRLIGGATIANNFFDPSGIGTRSLGGGNWVFVGNYNDNRGGPYHGTVTMRNNQNMLTGAPILRK